METETIEGLDERFGERSLELSRKDFQRVGRGANEAVKLDELIRETERKVEEETIKGENPHDAYEEEFQPNREIIAEGALGE